MNAHEGIDLETTSQRQPEALVVRWRFLVYLLLFLFAGALVKLTRGRPVAAPPTAAVDGRAPTR